MTVAVFSRITTFSSDVDKKAVNISSPSISVLSIIPTGTEAVVAPAVNVTSLEMEV